MPELNGRCSCGAISYKLSVEKALAYQCHCSACRKATGSSYSTTLMAPEKNFIWEKGNELISSYSKDNGYKINFCANCGGPVPNKFRDYPLYSVPVGSIEHAPKIRIVAQIYMDSKADWGSETLEGEMHSEMPSLERMMELLGINDKH